MMENHVISEIDLSTFCNPPFSGDKGFPSKEQVHTANLIDESFQKNGFMIVRNFGLNEHDISEAFKFSKLLFDQTLDHKLKRLAQFNMATNEGYSPMGIEVVNKKRAPDIRETYNFRPVPGLSSHHLGTPCGFKDWSDKFSADMEKAARTFAAAMAVALKVSPDYFLDCMKAFDGVSMAERSVVRLTHYPPCDYKPKSAEDPKSALRVGEHTDFGLFTILFPGGPGLQTEVKKGVWESAPVPKSAAAIINTGAMFARWTNDKWIATAHRVVVENLEQAKHSRYSIVFFINPRGDTVVEAHHSFLKQGEMPKYPSVSADEYLTMRLKDAANNTTINNVGS